MIEIQAKQPNIYRFLKKVIEKNQLVHAYLFDGGAGTGKLDTATWLAQCYFCDNEPLACGNCMNCLRIEEGNHPDVHLIIPDGQSIKIDQMAQIKSHFGKSGLERSKQFLIISQAEKMTPQAANSLLKFIEEPSGQLEIVFITENKERVLATIQSRCQTIFFEPLPKALFRQDLLESGVAEVMVDVLSEMTTDKQTVLALSSDEWFNELQEIVEKWLHYLIKRDAYSFVYIQQHVVKHCKDKHQQSRCFQLMIAYLILFIQGEKTANFKELANWSAADIASVTTEVLQAEQRWQVNVPFQVTLEQLVLHVLRK
ncbi:DNA polymerase III subunit delta' [Vagococcus xieshaowenii]|uniref:DNA polymerase III subunit delta n=1 Tax=Vagococcus xieshaowenii TaxID=2562451 RepID=A0AAJ5EED2_9ENTE|nr:DNA polymerase III subunit delta' [Vagococcus xieshaowenii]QCA29092.1 DNA polymerase III subunit delta' [Vagococcus xieshaowenii]TFZ40932.1 DNA polymerase III subunit delta' [Vagococcus xieshaowenii]